LVRVSFPHRYRWLEDWQRVTRFPLKTFPLLFQLLLKRFERRVTYKAVQSRLVLKRRVAGPALGCGFIEPFEGESDANVCRQAKAFTGLVLHD
jgi:hypothetical protein